jgi:tripartite-type tricarboxylate transporter receptor subunit TctC
MRKRSRVLFRLLVLILTILASANLAYAASTDDGFYKGKTVRLIVAFSAGGGYDTYSRTIARHLGK